MAVDSDDATVLLPCGSDPIDVWDRAARDADDHERTCPYCQEVRSEHEEMARMTLGYLDEPVEHPDMLLQRVMSAVRTGMRTREWIELDGSLGPVRIDHRTAGTMLRWSLDRLDSLHVHRCSVVVSDQPHVIDVEVGVETLVGAPIDPLVQSVRDHIRALAAAMLSLGVGRIDVEVTDLFGDLSLETGVDTSGTPS